MTENRKAFILYNDIIHVTKDLTIEEKGLLFDHIIQYVNDNNPVTEDRIIKCIFEPIRLQLERDFSKYEKVKEKKREAGKEGGIKSGEKRRLLSGSKNSDSNISIDNQNVNEANEANGSFGSSCEANASFALNNEANEAITNTSTITSTITKTSTIKEKEAKASAPTPEIPKYSEIDKSGNSIASYIRQYKPKQIEPYKDLWNLFAADNEFSQIRDLNNSRKSKFKIRVQEKTFDFVAVLYMAKQSKFIMENSFFTFDWIFENDSNYLKVIEGNYKNDKSKSKEPEPEVDWRTKKTLMAL